MIKKIILLLVLLSVANSFSQKPVDLPAVLINSMQLKVELINGVPYYEYKENNKKLSNTAEYAIMTHVKRKKKSYDPEATGEGDDIVREDFMKGKYLNIDKVGFFHNGYKNGLWKTLYYTKLVKTINYKNGLVVGKYHVYNSDGKSLYKINFGAAGDGKFFDYYYKTGDLKQEGYYEDGKKEGEWCDYNKQGEITKSIIYKKGVPQKTE